MKACFQAALLWEELRVPPKYARNIFVIHFLGIICLMIAVPSSAADSPPADHALTFERNVRPILKANCFRCHGEDGEMDGEFDLRLRRLIVAGGETGPAIIPGNHKESYLFERIQSEEMPPDKKKLSDAQIDTIGRWIEQGAPTARPEPAEIGDGLLVTEEERAHWSFQPIVRPSVPTVRDETQIQTPIDAFLLARLENEELTFSPPAEKRDLIRRAYFDLTGLPPTPEEVEQFVEDESSEAYDQLIDRLLASHEYGERWGRHWLDVAGYADSEGYTEADTVRKYAYKYRDYVIRAFNDDMPFDRFIQEQLAGDEMVPTPPNNLSPADIDKIVATGFLRMAPDGTATGGIDKELACNAVVAETINIVSTSLLGMTVGCAQCHDHRYDPISQIDYYRMRAIFEPVYDVKNWRNPTKRQVSLYTDEDRTQSTAIEDEAKEIDARRLGKQTEYIEATFVKELAKIPQELKQQVRDAFDTPAKERTEEQLALFKEYPSANVTAGSLYLFNKEAAAELKEIAAEAAKIRATKTVEDFIRATTEVVGKVSPTHLFYRGNHSQPREIVAPGGLSILDSLQLPPVPENETAVPTTGRRLAYAKRLTSGEHPLTARVLMNRVWMHHFGRGIVEAMGDFGALGDLPSHPKLLDWLADEFMAGGWQLKRMHKLLMTSTVYRQSSHRSPRLDQIDPENRLYGRMPVRRMEAEVVRDAILAVSGKLNRTQFGSPVPVMLDEVGQVVVGVDTTDTSGRPTGKFVDMKGEDFRRSVYVQVRRSQTLGVLETFDAPIMEPNCELRNNSTVAPQALMLMNSEFSVKQAEYFAKRIQQDAGEDLKEQISRAWQLAFGRVPSDADFSSALTYLDDQTQRFAEVANEKAAKLKAANEKNEKQKKEPAKGPTPELQALATFCQALISSNGFLYID